MVGEILSGVMFATALGALVFGYPVAFTLGGVATLFAGIGYWLGVFDLPLLAAVPSRIFGIMLNEVLVAVPLFIFMGLMLQRSNIADELLRTMGQLFGRVRGGLGISVVLVGALLAASTGIVGATVVTMGVLSIPAMVKAGYDKRLASGIVCSSGTLGQIIPPSTILIFLSDILQGANSAAQLSLGNLTASPVSVGDLFIGSVIPGLVLVGLYILWIVITAIVQPERCPTLELSKEDLRALPKQVVRVLIPPLLLIVAVLGSILAGYATPTEAASVGAIGAVVLTALKGRLSVKAIGDVAKGTLTTTSMVFVILIGATVFTLVFRGLGGEAVVEDILESLPGGKIGAIIFVMAVMFVLGFFLDTFEIVFLIVPIAGTAILKMGVDPIWLGVLIGINLQTSFLTPPFGFALFFLKGAVGNLLPTSAIYRGVMPFVALQLLVMGSLIAFPQMATKLPEIVFATPTASGNAPPPTPREKKDSYGTY